MLARTGKVTKLLVSNACSFGREPFIHDMVKAIRERRPHGVAHKHIDLLEEYDDLVAYLNTLLTFFSMLKENKIKIFGPFQK